VKYPKGTTEHPVNKSGKRKILVSVWDFGAVHPQSERSHYVCNDHPAKMRPSLARALLQLYGESPVLDPMAGVGTTLVEAMLLGMDAIGVEYEKNFVVQANENIKYVQKICQSENSGNAVCIQGDARNLSCLDAAKVNTVLTSPPYFDALRKGDEGPHSTNNRISYRERLKRFQGYSEDKGNIGNMTDFGSIILSPPYEGALNASKHVGGIVGRDPQLAKTALYSTSKDNIGNTIGPNYLGEMLKVYRECYRVLKPGKFMVVVVKDIQRNWKTIPLGADTIKLCQLAGFECHDVIVNKMYFPSFWMLSLAKHSQKDDAKGTQRFHVLKSHEYVLVLRKPLN
jgi:DNA modification methylase